MEKISSIKALKTWLSLGLMALILSVAGLSRAAEEAWPKRFQHPKGEVVMYQPQLETFKDDKLTARAAVSVKTKEMKQPVFGAVWLAAKVAADRDTRMGTIDDVKITDAKFPSAINVKPEQIDRLKTFLNTEMEDWTFTLALDRMITMLELVEKEKLADQGLKSDPPKVIVVDHPAVLVPLDGEPKLLPMPQSKLMRVANTAFLMVYDPATRAYFLKGGGDWLSAAGLQGPWKDVAALPQAVKTLEADIDQEAGQEAKKVETKAGKLPEIIISTVPAELIATEGEPQFTPISGTNLLFVANTESNVFLDTGTQEYYVLLSGRWFKSKSLKDGPWTYAAPDQLPGDFARIPENSVKGFVLVNVAGTPLAEEAVQEMYIPQTAAIDRKKATTKVEYVGNPQWEKIANTDLSYAVNTGQAVFKQGTRYYAVDQGVWYEADSPDGPWKVSVKPPQQVEQLPPGNPHYNAKYVKVYDATEDVAYVGYTPGYTGSYVQDGTVVYGTGYDYPAYATETAYIPAPATYGYAANYDPYEGSWGYSPPYYQPWSWLGTGLATAAAVGLTWAAWDRWWDRGHNYYGGGRWGAGGYNYININNIHNNVIGRPNRPDWRPDHWRPGERWPGERPGLKPGERPGRPATLPANLYNRAGNQNRLASRPGQPATLPASNVVGGKPQRPGQLTGPGTDPKRPGQPQAGQPRPVQGKPGQNNVMADKNGNVYRKTQQGWQERQGGNWTKPATTTALPKTRPSPTQVRPSGSTSRPAVTPRPAAPRPGFNPAPLNQEFAARQRGQVRTQNFQRATTPRPTNVSRPAGGGGGGFQGGGGSPRGGGGGGSRGGGGGRRR
jgi:hypothetical protein